ncbi:hypothetical protein TWF694_009169 [Orbilia ellipsospora]|uniref:Uncharacterized protein n=1 Tax=Orbilia ellipsospora TaxID=2528407 RepID=A0AAV9XE34_9PEZI
MKPLRPSNADVILGVLKRGVKPKPGPFQRLSNFINAPVLTEKESRAWLNEINSSFRTALDGARHQNDIRPPASIQNTYANKADNHVSRILTEIPTSEKHEDLRNLLDPEGLVDTSPIAIFEKHYAENTATVLLASACLQKYVLDAQKKGFVVTDSGGFDLWKVIQHDPKFVDDCGPIAITGDQIGDMINQEGRFRFWLVVALMISPRPTIPFQWVRSMIEHQRYDAAALTLKLICNAYEFINSGLRSNTGLKLFIHFLNSGDPKYRAQPSKWVHRTRTINTLSLDELRDIYRAVSTSRTGRRMVLQNLGAEFYRSADEEGKQRLAESFRLWGFPMSAIHAEIALVHFGDFGPAVDYFLSSGDSTPSPLLDPGFRPEAIITVGMLAANKLASMGKQEVAEKIDVVLSEKFLSPLKEAAKGISLKQFLSKWVDNNMKSALISNGGWFPGASSFIRHQVAVLEAVSVEDQKPPKPSISYYLGAN